jgi:hypothetical protein
LLFLLDDLAFLLSWMSFLWLLMLFRLIWLLRLRCRGRRWRWRRCHWLRSGGRLSFGRSLDLWLDLWRSLGLGLGFARRLLG